MQHTDRPDQHVLTLLPGNSDGGFEVSIQWASPLADVLVDPSAVPPVNKEVQQQQRERFEKSVAACKYQGSSGAWRQWWTGLTAQQQQAFMVGVATFLMQ